MIYAFDTIEIDVEKHELRRDGALVPVEPQVLSLLVLLVRERERVVSKDELIEVVWEGRFVSDSAVSSRIKSARQAIGDDGQAQRFIKTVHGTGFRFIAPVTVSEAEMAALTDAPTAGKVVAGPIPSREKRKPHMLWLGAVIAAVAAAVALFLVFQPMSRNVQANQVRVAVLPVHIASDVAENGWAELGLMSLVSHKLEQEAAVSSVSPRAMIEGTGEQVVAATDALEIPEDLIRKLRQTEGASHFVVSRLTSIGARLHLDVAVRGADGRESRGSFDGEQILELADLMVRHIVSSLPGRQNAAIRLRTSPEDPFVAEAYARGLAYALQGRAEEARNLFAVAVEQDPEDIWLRYEYALATRQIGDLEGAEAQLTTLQAEAEAKDNPEVLASILNAVAIVNMLRNDDAAALASLEKALPISAGLTDHTRSAAILINLGILERRRRQYDQAEIYLTRAFAEFDAAGITAPPGALLNTMALLRIEQLRPAEAVQYLERALQRFHLDGNDRFAAAVKNNLGDIREMAGDYAGAFVLYNEGLTLRRAVNDPFGIASSLQSLVSLSVDTGRLEQAESLARELLKNGEARDDKFRQGQAHSYLGRVASLRGDADFARQHHRRAFDLFEAAKREGNMQSERIRLARLEHTDGAAASAVAAVQTVLAWARSEGVPADIMEAEAALAEFALKEGRSGEARRHAEASVAAARELPEANKLGRALVSLAGATLAAGDLAAAKAALDEAAKLVPQEAGLYRMKSKLAQAEGQTVEAVSHLRKARELAGELWTKGDEESFAALENP
ncbi:tetratricopeptide repeat protein [Gimibacter soli]|uniref:Tetratricopeptide repeat protein n=1 Tax=Gimibacter soli TaxID=3024400 RepID=A0AAE9XLE8_9PROT|nr:tetratricopeptide repeat protein [Gimibacter soli]WCL53299.1 tetratricopeptide repeat protein [Gimibacter soli]